MCTVMTVYFIGAETGPVKIGYTRDEPQSACGYVDAERRLAELQPYSPAKLKVLAILRQERPSMNPKLFQGIWN
jgi:hypothetical protein